MSEEKQDSEKKKAFSRLYGTPFTNFSKPYLDFIGKRQLFIFIYTVMEIVSLLFPFVIIYKVIDFGLFRSGEAKIIFTFIFSWLVIAFAFWIGFQLWWDRKSTVKTKIPENSGFIATLIFSEIIQTFGEWLGTLIGIIGAGVGLIATIFLGDYAHYLFSAIGMGFMPSGIIVVIAGPLFGFLLIITFRFVAEQMRLFVALVNNTKCIATNIKGVKKD